MNDSEFQRSAMNGSCAVCSGDVVMAKLSRVLKSAVLAGVAFGFISANASAADVTVTGSNGSINLYNWGGEALGLALHDIVDFTISGLVGNSTATINALVTDNYVSRTNALNGPINVTLYSSSNTPLGTLVDNNVSDYGPNSFNVSFAGLKNGTYSLDGWVSEQMGMVSQVPGMQVHVAAPTIGSVSAVPLPAALPMFGAALVGLGGLARRRAKKAA